MVRNVPFEAAKCTGLFHLNTGILAYNKSTGAIAVPRSVRVLFLRGCSSKVTNNDCSNSYGDSESRNTININETNSTNEDNYNSNIEIPEISAEAME